MTPRCAIEGLVRRGVFALGAAALLALSACHSYHVDATVENHTGAAIQLLEVDYPSASFGANTLAAGAVFSYRIQLRGIGPLKVHGRCLGHGGMPVATVAEVPAPHAPLPSIIAPGTPPLRFLDNRAYQTNPDGSVFGWNGYLKLSIAGDTVSARYFDIASILAPGACDEFAEIDDQDKLLLEDTFTLAPTGAIACQTTQHNLEPNFYGPAKWG